MCLLGSLLLPSAYLLACLSAYIYLCILFNVNLDSIPSTPFFIVVPLQLSTYLPTYPYVCSKTYNSLLDNSLMHPTDFSICWPENRSSTTVQEWFRISLNLSTLYIKEVSSCSCFWLTIAITPNDRRLSICYLYTAGLITSMMMMMRRREH